MSRRRRAWRWARGPPLAEAACGNVCRDDTDKTAESPGALLGGGSQASRDGNPHGRGHVGRMPSPRPSRAALTRSGTRLEEEIAVSILPDPASAVGAETDRTIARPLAGADEAAAARIAALVDPPAYCPGCLAERGAPWPDGATTRHCPRCLDRIRRVHQCATWNADRAHQVAAGHASWDAFSARWRASSGLPPLSMEAARRYVAPDLIRGPLGALLPTALREAVHRAWHAGLLVGVSAWLSDDPPPDPAGLWASGAPGGGVDVGGPESRSDGGA